MRINSSNIGMASARNFSSCSGKTISLLSVTKKKAGAWNGNGIAGAKTGKNELEDALARFRNQRNTVKRPGATDTLDQIEQANRIRNQCIRYLLELFLGGRGKGAAAGQDGADPVRQEPEQNVVQNTYQYHEEAYLKEEESTSFTTTGKVVTADGRELSFHLEMQMSRSFEAYYEKNYSRTVTVCDPLVINLDGNAAEVSDQKFLFDLDCDGEEESISFLGSGSGYLAFDQNGDGTINDGSELFGTKSGDGFADLARYDQDGNGWIDENDEIFQKLVIWCRDEDGRDVMYKLADKGVGAVCLQNVNTDFSLNSKEDNSVNALVRRTGIFLYENGGAGTVQHLDMAT